jgi:hypothetical protein
MPFQQKNTNNLIQKNISFNFTVIKKCNWMKNMAMKVPSLTKISLENNLTDLLTRINLHKPWR